MKIKTVICVFCIGFVGCNNPTDILLGKVLKDINDNVYPIPLKGWSIEQKIEQVETESYFLYNNNLDTIYDLQLEIKVKESINDISECYNINLGP